MGTAELTSWISLDGRPLEGVIYKPADFDPNKKYPVIVNFYERNANTLYNYHMPSPGRSTIDYPFYLSHGFIISILMSASQTAIRVKVVTIA